MSASASATQGGHKKHKLTVSWVTLEHNASHMHCESKISWTEHQAAGEFIHSFTVVMFSVVISLLWSGITCAQTYLKTANHTLTVLLPYLRKLAIQEYHQYERDVVLNVQQCSLLRDIIGYDRPKFR